MFEIRHETPFDAPVRDALLDRCFGEARFAKTSERLREGRLPAEGLAFCATRDARLVATLRLWNVEAGPSRAALLLGPVAVEPQLQGVGIGARLIGHALAHAVGLGHVAVLLVGDQSYYGRFGFARHTVAGLDLPGPYDPERFLGLELAPDALAGSNGLVQATGAAAPWRLDADAVRREGAARAA